ncbi:hypothetical protein BH09MYX1_BH09MYX1_15220 [soil metagenome]
MICSKARPSVIGLILLATSAVARPLLADEAPRRGAFGLGPVAAGFVWAATQLVPSPLFVMGSSGAGGGVRWQVTPLLVSWGIVAKPVRSFIVDPIARHSGSIELFAAPEWLSRAPNDATGWIARGGVRITMPLEGRGETLSWSIGGSYYRASGGDGFSAELGVYFLYGVFGFTVTFSPTLADREIIHALTIRYF